jgi:hypothetical protein
LDCHFERALWCNPSASALFLKTGRRIFMRWHFGGAALGCLILAHPQTTRAADTQPADSTSSSPSASGSSQAAQDDSQSDVAPVLPIANRDRPPTLPKHYVRIDTSISWNGLSGSSSYELDGVLGGGFGVTDWFEVGGQLIPGSLAPNPSFGSPLLYGAFVVLNQTWSIVPTLQLSIPVTASQAWLLDGLVAVSGVVGEIFIFSTSPSISMTVSDKPIFTVALPLQASVQLSQRFLAGLQTGVGFAQFDPRTNTARAYEPFDLNDLTFPLGFSATMTAGVDDGPLVDLSLLFLWSSFLEIDPDGDVLNTGDWSVLLSASTYLGL